MFDGRTYNMQHRAYRLNLIHHCTLKTVIKILQSVIINTEHFQSNILFATIAVCSPVYAHPRETDVNIQNTTAES